MIPDQSRNRFLEHDNQLKIVLIMRNELNNNRIQHYCKCNLKKTQNDFKFGQVFTVKF